MQWHGLRLSLPDSSFFEFPPSSEPFPIPPPAPGDTLHAPPFQIPESIFQSVLDVRVPITIAAVYAVTVPIINKINKSRGNKPWAISKTKPFFWFVVLHNVFLAVYSAWTFVGMVGGLKRSLQRPDASTGLVGTVDSLCKINGVGGLGNAIAYHQTTNTWTTHNPQIHLAADGRPDSTDLGRLWNESLAFYGWWFYLSKFYEVFDTIIILAKGKRSSTLQTYHHAGAMLCMWAGIRYMSPPIWMFVTWNSLIHAIMYTYYTVTAFSVRVPQTIKQTLTTMQIMQFIVGAPYAALHSFLSYDIPVRVPTVRETISTALSSASSAVAAVATDPTLADTIKKLLFRAAGEGGVADNLAAASAASPVPAASGHHRHIVHKYKDPEPSYTTEYRDVPCLNTQGQTLAVWLNVFYLLPLTFLFGRFFVKSYITRTIGQGVKAKAKAIEHSGKDAVKGVDRKLDEYLKPADEKKGKNEKKVAEDKKEQQRKEEQKKQESKKEDVKRAEEKKQADAKKNESSPASTEKSKSNLSEKSEDFEKIEHDDSSKPAQDADSDNEDDAAESTSTPNTPSKKKKNKKKKKKAPENLVEADAPPPITPANVTAGVADMSFADAVKEEL